MNNLNLPSSSELSDNLTNILRSAFSEKFPGSLVTVLDSLTPASDTDLLVSDGSPPLFYSDNPDENFPNIIGKYIDFLTTSSEPNIVASDDQEVKASWGRHGSDNLIGFDPATNHSGKQKIDVFTGDFTDEQLFGALSGQVDDSTQSHWKDRFILGDWQQPYYVEDETLNFGLDQFAFITDFNPNEDVIQLHGTAEDYELVDTDLGTAIFWRKETGYDLVAVTAKTSNLNLESDYFDFKGNTPPAGPVIEKATQIGTNGIDFLFASTVDAKGNLYVGGGTGGSLGGTNAGARDAWLAKYDSKGNQLWSKQFGTTGTETSWSMASDGNNIYVAGNTAGTLGTTSQGGRDIYLAKYDSDGNQQWIRQFGTLSFDESFRVTTDTNGNIYVGGHTVGGLAGENKNVGQDPNNFAFPSTDSFVVKFDTNGNQLWAQQFGTVELDDNWGVTTDKDGNIFAGGNTKGNFGGQNAGFYDNWLVKLDKQDGSKLWVKQFGSSDYDFLWDLKTDSIGNLYATGYTLGDLGGKNAGSSDIYLAKFDNDGNQQWIKQFGTSGDDAPFVDGLEVDSDDNIFLTGYTDSNLGGANAGSYDVWVAKYDKDGTQLWIKQFGTPDYDTATTISADGFGNVYVSGITEGSLGGINSGSYDSWVVKLDSDKGTIQDFTGNGFSVLQNNPTDLKLSATNVDENVPDNTVIGTFTTIDTDPDDTFTYNLVNGVDDNSFFTINGNNLIINQSPDFETKSSYKIRARTTDKGGLTFEKDFVIGINDIQNQLLNPKDDVFKISGETTKVKLKIKLSGRQSSLVNELGVFTVDDSSGTINGIAPGTTGYTQSALERSKVIFSVISNNPNGFDASNISRLLEFNSNQNLRFYLIKNSTFDTVQKTSFSSEILFSSSLQKNTANGSSFTLGWQDGSNTNTEFNDLVVNLEATDEASVLGTSLQGTAQSEVIDLRSVSGSVSATFTVNREASFNNFVGFYRVTGEDGGIDTNNDGVTDFLPGQTGYIQAAINQREAGINLTVSNQGTATYTGIFSGGAIFAPFIIVNGSPDAVLDNNTNNDPSVYFPYLGANSDQADHIRLLGDNVFGFEDLPNGGDKDYNDVILKVNLSIA